MSRTPAFAILLAIILVTGCRSSEPVATAPDYARPLPPGAPALRLVTDPTRMPDLETAWKGQRESKDSLRDALDESVVWFAAPSSQRHYPMAAGSEHISHAHAAASVEAFRALVDSTPTARDFAAQVAEQFDVYESVGYDGDGIVLYTGYYAPIFDARREASLDFSVPLYSRPADLVTDPDTGRPLGRRTASDEIVPYYTRREIEDQNILAGHEIFWVRDELTAYIIHVNGSARLTLGDGTTTHIGYAGKTDREYYGLGRSMIDEGLATEDQLNLPAIRNAFRRNPDRIINLIYRNESYVFFTEYPEGRWPAGSLGVRVTEKATLATDKAIYPRGGVVLVDTDAVTLSYQKQPFLRFMLDQDTGGAIRAPGRADIFMGTGETAEVLAGGQYAEGRLYYFFLKPDHYAAAEALSRAEE